MKPRVRHVCALGIVALLAGCGRGDALQGAVLVVLDTLRPDHLSAYGYERPTSPAIDALAARGVLFERAVSNSSWTLPAMVALLSGRYASEEVFAGGLRTSQVTALAEAGFRTAAFTEGGFASAHFGFDLGFEHFEETEGPVRLRVGGAARGPGRNGGIEHTFARAEAWLREHAGERFFLLVHTYEVHTPYRRHHFTEGAERGALGDTFEIADVERVRQGLIPVGATERDYLTRLYDGGVLEADRHVGALAATLAELGLADRTLVVVTSDHGEDLGARDPAFAGDHGHTLYDELLRVPLVWVDPSEPRPGRRVGAQVRSVDVLPAIVDRLGADPLPGADGRGFGGLLRDENDGSRAAVARLFPRGGGRLGPLRTAWCDGRRKLLVNFPFVEPPAPTVELFDLRADPGERRNLAGTEPGVRAELSARLRAATDALEAAGRPDFRVAEDAPDALRERLESLGYVE